MESGKCSLGVINELTSVMSPCYKQQVEKKSQQQKVLRSKEGVAVLPRISGSLAGWWIPVGTRDPGLALFLLSGALIGVHNRMNEMGGQQHTSLQKSGRREGEKIQFSLLVAKQQHPGKRVLRCSKKALVLLSSFPRIFLYQQRHLVPILWFAATWCAG